MSDPRLVYRNPETGEGILIGDDGAETSVHLPSLPADFRFVDETREPSQTPAPQPFDDGILGTPAPRIVYPQSGPDRQAQSPFPPLAEQLHGSGDRSALLMENPPTVEPDPFDPRSERGPRAPIDPRTTSPQALRDALRASPTPTFTRSPDPLADVPAEWLRSGPDAHAVDPRTGVPLPPSAEELARRDAALRGAPVRVGPSAASIPTGMRGPTPEEIARGRAVDLSGAPLSSPSRTARGTASPPSPRTPVMSPQVVRDFSQPEAFEQTISGITGSPQATRGSPGNPYDIVDRRTQVALEQNDLARQDARRQALVESEAQAQRAQDEQERRQAMGDATQRYQRAIDRVASARIDPNGWFRDQGAFGVVGATLATALGAVGQALTGASTNGALDQINEAINRDIAAQQSEIESGRAAAEAQHSMLGVMRSEFDDRQAATDATRAGMLQQAALHLQEMTADVADHDASVNAEALRTQLEAAAREAQQAAIDRQLAQRLQAARVARTEAMAVREQRRAMGGGAARPQRYTTPMYEAFERAIAGGATREEAARQTGFAPEDAPRHSSMTTEQRGTLDAFSQALDSLEGQAPSEDIPGVGFFDALAPGPEGRRYRQSIDNAVDLLGRLRSGAAITEQEADRFEAIIGAGHFQTEEEFRNGLRLMRRELGARLGRTGERDAAPDRDAAAYGVTFDEAP